MLFIIHVNKCNLKSVAYLEILLCSLITTFLEDSVFTGRYSPHLGTVSSVACTLILTLLLLRWVQLCRLRKHSAAEGGHYRDCDFLSLKALLLIFYHQEYVCCSFFGRFSFFIGSRKFASVPLLLRAFVLYALEFLSIAFSIFNVKIIFFLLYC